MSSWNYRIIRYADGGYGLHEVGYDHDICPTAPRCACEAQTYAVEPADFVCDEEEGYTGIIASLKRAIEDAENNTILQIPETWDQVRKHIHEQYALLRPKDEEHGP